MSHYKPYPAYKDSGVEWLGKVPEHWRVSRLASIFDERRTKVSDKDYPALSVTKQGVVPQLESVAKTDDGDNRRLVCKGDIAINSRSDRKGSSGLVDRDGSVSLIITVLKPLNLLLGGYAHHLIRSEAFQEEFYRVGNGLVADLWTTSYSSMREIKLALPPVDEQEVISTCLDRETARIDALISKKTRFIELLREKRQALITHAVTKGLEPNVKMKDSGVEWLGVVPEHWAVASIKNWFRTSSGGTPDTSRQSEFYTENGGHPWVRTTDLNNGELWEAEVQITDAALSASACSLLPENTVAVAMYGGDGTIGKFSILRFSTTINQALCALLPNRHFVPEFVYWYVQHYRPYWMVGAESTRKDPNISQELIRAAPIVRPPLDEQLKISRKLREETERVDLLLGKNERSIELLKERRSALITAAISGQINFMNGK